jgi:hypothetical protein
MNKLFQNLKQKKNEKNNYAEELEQDRQAENQIEQEQINKF